MTIFPNTRRRSSANIKKSPNKPTSNHHQWNFSAIFGERRRNIGIQSYISVSRELIQTAIILVAPSANPPSREKNKQHLSDKLFPRVVPIYGDSGEVMEEQLNKSPIAVESTEAEEIEFLRDNPRKIVKESSNLKDFLWLQEMLCDIQTGCNFKSGPFREFSGSSII